MTNETTTHTPLKARLQDVLNIPCGALRSETTTYTPLGAQHAEEGLVDIASTLTFDDYDNDTVTEIAEARLAVIEVDDIEDSLFEVWERCDARSGDLECVATRLRLVADQGALAQIFATKLIIVDAVAVNEPFRGMGAGKLVAAAALHAAGALAEDALTAAIPGCRTGNDEDRASVTAAAGGVLNSIGLTRHSTDLGDVYTGDPCNLSFEAPIRLLVALG